MISKGGCCSLTSIEPLTRTGVWEEVIVGGFPKEVAPYKGLWIPFDELTWILLLVSFIAVAVVLFGIEKIWIMTTSEGIMKYDGRYHNTILLVHLYVTCKMKPLQPFGLLHAHLSRGIWKKNCLIGHALRPERFFYSYGLLFAS